MKYANDFTKSFVLADDILSIAAMAKKRKLENNETIDATIGALLDDDGKLLSFSVIEELRCELDQTKLRAYPPVDGGKPFQNAVRNWVFKQHRAAIESHFHVASLATPGASGALSNILSNYTTKDDVVLIPDIHWSNYQAIINQTSSSYDTYPLFKDFEFNLDGFISKTLEIKQKTNKLVILLNDPAQNPTGYSLKNEELKAIIKHLDALSKEIPVVLIYDIAYLDYADAEYENTRDRFLSLLDIESDMLVAICFSASKTFGIYGLRGGALIGLSKNEQIIDEFHRISTYRARSIWSCPPTTPILIMNALDADENLKLTFVKELKQVRSLLQKRADLFLKEALKANLETLPYTQGFFITIKAKDPVKTFNGLINEDIFIIPLQNAIRVALSAINEKDIIGLPEKLKKHL